MVIAVVSFFVWILVTGGIGHFDNQKAAFQGGVKCGKSAADTVAVEICPSTSPIL